jgi:hypothetical protein
MQGDIRLIADYPAIVAGRAWRNVEEGAGAEFVDGAVVHGRGGAAGEDQADVFDIAAGSTDGRADVLGPLPAGLVRGAADGHGAEVDEFEFSLFEGAYFVGGLEAFEDYFESWLHFFASRFGDAATPRGILAQVNRGYSGG